MRLPTRRQRLLLPLDPCLLVSYMPLDGYLGVGSISDSLSRLVSGDLFTALPPQLLQPLAPVAQLRRLVVVLTRPVNPVRRDARVRVGLAEGEEVDPRLERADLCGNQSV